MLLFIRWNETSNRSVDDLLIWIKNDYDGSVRPNSTGKDWMLNAEFLHAPIIISRILLSAWAKLFQFENQRETGRVTVKRLLLQRGRVWFGLINLRVQYNTRIRWVCLQTRFFLSTSHPESSLPLTCGRETSDPEKFWSEESLENIGVLVELRMPTWQTLGSTMSPVFYFRLLPLLWKLIKIDPVTKLSRVARFVKLVQ